MVGLQQMVFVLSLLCPESTPWEEALEAAVYWGGDPQKYKWGSRECVMGKEQESVKGMVLAS